MMEAINLAGSRHPSRGVVETDAPEYRFSMAEGKE